MSEHQYEKAVIGACLMYKQAFGQVCDILQTTDFTEPRDRIWQAMSDLFMAGEPIDILTVRGKLHDMGAKSEVLECTGKVAGADNVEHHAKLVVEETIRKQIPIAAARAVSLSEQDPLEAVHHLEIATMSLMARTGRRREETAARLADRVTDSVYERVKAVRNGVSPGIPTGLRKIDHMTGGVFPGDLVIIGGRPSMGKAQPIWSKVMTPYGWKRIGDIKKGDFVIGGDGNPVLVRDVFPQGVKQVYRVELKDGGVTHCCEDHLWYVSPRAKRKEGDKDRVVMPLKEMMRKGIRIGDRCNYSIPYASPVWMQQREHKIDPYLIGVYLGDGSSSLANVCIHNTESDIWDKVESALPFGDSLSKFDKRGVTRRVRGGGLKNELKRLGLCGLRSWEKFIPEEYIYTDVNSRIRLIQGLFDTDGHICKQGTNIEYSSASKELADGIVEIVKGLGARVTITKRKSHYTINGERTECRASYRIVCSFENDIIPVSSKKRLDRFRGINRKMGRFISDVTFWGEDECVCISVANEDGLYVTDDYIVTHNTAYMLALARGAAENGHMVGILSLEMRSEQLIERLASAYSGIEYRRVRMGDLTDQELSDYGNALVRVKRLPIMIDDEPGLNVMKYRSKCKRLADKGCKVILVDYLQLIEVPGMERRHEVGKVTKTGKQLAKELGVAMIQLSQIGRASENDALKIPEMKHLSESANIEMDADVIWLLWRPEYYGIEEHNGDPTKDLMYVIQEKDRNGVRGWRYKLDCDIGTNQIGDVYRPSARVYADQGFDAESGDTPF